MEKIKAIWASKRILVLAVGGAVVLIAAALILIAVNARDASPDTALEIPTETEKLTETPQTEPLYEEEDVWEEDDFWEEDETEEETETEETPATTKRNNAQMPDYLQSTPRKYYSHLTGLRVTRAQQRIRPVSVIINNIRVSMPTVGVGRADIIYECMVEGGITRLMMVLTDYESVPVFGSTRSSREYFIDLSRSHDTIYVHAGGNPQDYEQFQSRSIERIDGVNSVTIYGRTSSFGKFFYRDQERRKTMALEHTLMISGDGVVGAIEQQKYRTTLESDFAPPFYFNEEPVDLGPDRGREDNIANYVNVPYSNAFNAEFIYNTEDELYYRKQYGRAHIDGETGEQIRFENVIVLFAEYTPFRGNDIARREGHYACKLTGTGFGFYINGGKYKTIRWQKDTRDGSMNLFNFDRTDLYLNPGKSFICVTNTTYNKSVIINSDIKPIE